MLLSFFLSAKIVFFSSHAHTHAHFSLIGCPRPSPRRAPGGVLADVRSLALSMKPARPRATAATAGAKPATAWFVEFPADRFSELALQHSVTRGKAFEQLCTAATATTPAAQVLELKRLVPLVATTDSIAERRLLAACVAELLLVPHPFAFHTQLKLSLGALCSAEAEAERALHDTLSARLAALVALRSLCPGGRVLPGVLREGSMPGWLPLLLDTPPGLVLLRVPMMGPLLRLVRARARARASPSPSPSPNP